MREPTNVRHELKSLGKRVAINQMRPIISAIPIRGTMGSLDLDTALYVGGVEGGEKL